MRSSDRDARPGGRRPFNTVHEYVKAELRSDILSGQRAAGSRLIQQKVAAQYGASTTPVREALRDLVVEGLVSLDPHKGAMVREVDLEEFLQLYEIRAQLEPLAARKAVQRVSDEQLEQARELLDRSEATRDPSEWIMFNRQFHAALTDACGSPPLTMVLDELRSASSLYVGFAVRATPAYMERGNAEHRAMLEAVAARDEDLTARLALDHLHLTQQATGADLDGQAHIATGPGAGRA